MEITVRGESSIKISGKTNHKKWKKKTTANWSVSIVAEPSPSGLRLKVTGGAQPVVSEVEAEGDCIWDLVHLHGNYMPKSVDIMAVVDSLRDILEGTWEYSCPGSTTYALINPVFTVTGHLIVSLVSQNTPAPPVFAAATATDIATVSKSKSTTVQISNSVLTTSATALLTASSSSESPLPTPQIDYTYTKGPDYGVSTPKYNGASTKDYRLSTEKDYGASTEKNYGVSTETSYGVSTEMSYSASAGTGYGVKVENGATEIVEPYEAAF